MAKETQQKESYIRRPYSFFQTEIAGRKPKRSELVVMGAIFSFSEGEEGLRCRLSYTKFCQKYHLSNATVAGAVKALKEAELIEQDKSSRAGASYKYLKEAERGFIRTDRFLYHMKFAVGGEERFLTKAEVDVLSLIVTHSGNAKNGEKCDGSVRSMARTLNLSKTTVQSALTALLHAGLIYRPRECKGVNGHRRSVYKANERLLRPLRRKFEKGKAATVAPTDEDEKIAREKFYADRRRRAITRAEYFRVKLMSDDTYSALYRERAPLDIRIAEAEVYGFPTLGKLKKDAEKLDAALLRRMQQLGISREDLDPVFACEKCSDTGFLPDGRACDCYPFHRRRRQT